MYICLFVHTWYIHVHTMYVHVWYFLTCMYMLNTCLYHFSKSCPGGQDSRWFESPPDDSTVLKWIWEWCRFGKTTAIRNRGSKKIHPVACQKKDWPLQDRLPPGHASAAGSPSLEVGPPVTVTQAQWLSTGSAARLPGTRSDPLPKIELELSG